MGGSAELSPLPHSRPGEGAALQTGQTRYKGRFDITAPFTHSAAYSREVSLYFPHLTSSSRNPKLVPLSISGTADSERGGGRWQLLMRSDLICWSRLLLLSWKLRLCTGGRRSCRLSWCGCSRGSCMRREGRGWILCRWSAWGGCSTSVER